MLNFRDGSIKFLPNRRDFLGYAGAGLLMASVRRLDSVLPFTGDVKQPGDKRPGKEELKPVTRKNLSAASERPEGEYFTPVNPQKKIGFAIVGLGNLALGQVLPAFGNSKYCKPVALVSGHPGKAKKVAVQYGIPENNVYSYENFDAIKNNEEVDVVYIILPNSMHHEFTLRAAKAGKHVLCEKPMANSAKEGEEMIAACGQAGRKLMVAYRIQYEPHSRQCREWIREKEFGTVKLLEFYNGQNIGDASQWRLKKDLSGGGPLVDVGIYCLNTCRYLIGEEPEAVFASLHHNPSDPRFKEVEESMLFHLYFPGGVMASCTTTFGAHLCRRYRAFTDKGAWFGMDPAFEYKGVKMEVSRAQDLMEWKSTPALEEKNQFSLEMDHLAQCIYNDKDPFTKGEEGLQDLRIIEALYRSASENKIIQLERITGKDPFRGTMPDKNA